MVEDQLEEARVAAEAPAPAWPWVLAGVLLGLWIAARDERAPRARPELHAGPPSVHTGLRSTGERVPSARELRAVDGVGPIRALRLARAWWENGPPASQRSLEALEDIGPATAAKVWQALATHDEAASSCRGPPVRFPAPCRSP